MHVTAWREAYAGIAPQACLDDLDERESAERWSEKLKGWQGGSRGLLVAVAEGQAVGFVAYGPSRDKAVPHQGELYAIYLLAAAKGRGIGYALFKDVRERLRRQGFDSLYLWVLEDNVKARSAYLRWGGLQWHDLSKTIEIGGATFSELAIGFG